MLADVTNLILFLGENMIQSALEQFWSFRQMTKDNTWVIISFYIIYSMYIISYVKEQIVIGK